ncbi:MAG TPA: HD domain-containing phosphohydrolase, partial [Gemmatimonadaceae bacterium]|nr:HD domain-containing phosphohydrolase [Gemmatimonadaceae bacterium]
PRDAVYEHNEYLDKTFGYHTRSLLVVPMINRRDEVLGVLVLINKKTGRHATIRNKEDADRYVLPYSDRDVRLARSLAGQAAVSIENTRLYTQIENLLQSFVKAAATAIDQRDPTTAGHSLRVAALATDLAAAVERDGRGPYQHVRFSRAQMRELQFAALLHDFGKVGVKEDVLLKSKKLPVYLWERVNARFDLIRRTKEADHYRLRAEACDRGGGDKAGQMPSDAQLHEQLDELTRMRELVGKANEPDLLPEPPSAELREIARRTFQRPDGMVVPYLSDVEVSYLEIPQGTLDAQERVEIESHVEQTFQFLQQIPWTDDLKNLAMYAYGHHEKLDGTGYPRHVKAADIPIQTRLLTLADMFDALTEEDRPYKSPCSVEQALDIMQSEAKTGALDPELVRILVESQVYKRVLEQDWRGF